MKRAHVLATVDDTRALGEQLAAVLRPGDLVVLVGPLGAGKTALTQGIGAGLGGAADVDDLDLDASAEESVTVVEWGQGLVEQLADGHLQVRLDRRDDDVRTAELVPHGDGWTERLGQ